MGLSCKEDAKRKRQKQNRYNPAGRDQKRNMNGKRLQYLGEIVAERIGAKLAKLIVVIVSAAAAAAMRRTPDEILRRVLEILLVLQLKGS
jgi:hypothetical protein